MSSFYKPFTTRIHSLPVIVYPCTGLEKSLSRNEKQSISQHLESLYQANDQLLNAGTYHLIILWNESSGDPKIESKDVMTDVWIFDKIESWGSGPLVDVKIFRNHQVVSDIGVSAGDGLLLLGREEELRRSSSSLDDYLFGERCKLPRDIAPVEEWTTT